MMSQSYSSDHAEAYTNTYESDARQLSLSAFPITFTKRSFRQFSRVNQLLGKDFIRAFILYRELAAYITAHEEDGYHLDTICLDVRYDDNIYLLLMKCHGEWLITDVGFIGAADSSKGWAPVLVWQRITTGLRVVLRQILCGWKRVAMATTITTITAPTEPIYQNL